MSEVVNIYLSLVAWKLHSKQIKQTETIWKKDLDAK